MRRRSRAGGEPIKTRRRKMAARKRSNAPKASVRSSPPAGQETEVAWLTRELKEALEQRTATAEVLKIISTSPTEFQAVLEVVVRSAARFCKADDVTIFELDGQDIRVAAHWGAVPHLGILEIGFRFPCTRGSVAGRTVLERRPVHVSDLQAEAEDFPEGSALARRLGHRTVAGVPLLREGVAVGTIQLRRTEVNPFTDKQMALLETFAAQAVIAIENTRLLNELRQSLQQQTATADVLKVISRSTFDLQTVLDTLTESAALLCEADMASIIRQKGAAYYWATTYGFPPELREYLKSIPLEPGRGTVVGRILIEGKTVHIPDVLADPEYTLVEAQRKAGYRTALGVPLLREGMPIGIIALLRRSVQPFTEKQIELVTTFADQAVIAIENVRLFEEVQTRTHELTESLEQQTATSEVLKVISSSFTDTQPVFDAIVHSGLKLFPDAAIAIALPDGDQVRAAAIAERDPERVKAWKGRFPNPLSRDHMHSTAILDRRLIDVPDAEAYTAGPFVIGVKNFLASGYRAITIMPMICGDAAIGAMSVARLTPGPLSAKQIELLRTFADQAVIAIENVRLFEEVQSRTRELFQSVEELRALGEVGQAINSTLDVETVLTTIVVKAVQLSGTDAGAIYTFDESRQEFWLRATHGMDEAMIAAIRDRRIGAGETAIGKAAAERTPVQIPDVPKDSSLVLDVVVRAGYRAVLIVPLLRPEQIVGALVVRRKTPGEFPKSTIELLGTFAEQSVLAIQNARLFREIEDKGRQLAEASQHKSQFLANMSHELRTPLNAILGYTELMADGAYGEPSEKMLGILKRLEANGKHLLGLINDVLDLSKIEAGQLVLELSNYSVQDIAQTVRSTLEPLAADKKLSFKVDVAPKLPPGHGDGRRLTQVLINLVGNAIKFTDAGEVVIKAEANNGSFHVSVRDTGPGISPADQAKLFQEFQQADNAITKKKGGTGLGLAISKRIIEMHGGKIWVESQPGQGSTFAFSLPVIVERQVEAA